MIDKHARSAVYVVISCLLHLGKVDALQCYIPWTRQRDGLEPVETRKYRFVLPTVWWWE